MIEIKNVSYSYENAVTDGALKNVSLCIPEGQTVLLCGESGSGKTTFGRLVNGLIPCYYEGKLTGSVMVNGKDTTHLQLHELAGEGGLGDVEHLGRGRDALRLGHREKISQHPQFHGSASFPCIGFSITAVFMPYKHIKLF